MKTYRRIIYIFAAFFLVGSFFVFEDAKAAGPYTLSAPGNTPNFTITNSTPAGGASGSWNASVSYQSGSGLWSVSPNPASGTLAAQGSQSVNISVGGSVPPSGVTYQATVSYSGPGLSDSVTVYYSGGAAPSCSISYFNATTPITSGNASTLSWGTSNCTSASLTNVSTGANMGAVALTGSTSVSPASTTTYRLTANGSVTRDVTVTVNAAPVCTINSFSASPNPITSGNLSTLSWNTSNCSSAALFNVTTGASMGAVAVSGNTNVGPASTTTYRLIMDGGSTTRDITLTVNAPPPSGSCDINVSHTGYAPTFSYSLSPDLGGMGPYSGDNGIYFATGGNRSYTITYVSGNSVPPSSYSPAQTLFCGSNGTIEFTLNFPAATVGAPSNVASQNTAMNSAVSCDQIRTSWTAGTNAVSYNVYRTTNVATPGAIWQNTTSTTITDSSPGSTTWYYIVESVGSGGILSSKVSGNSVAATPCRVDLSTSGKYIAKINGTNNSYSSPCVTPPAGTSKIIRKDDTLTLRIEVCNSGSIDANSVTVTDNLAGDAPYLELTSPPNVSITGGTATSYVVNGNSIVFNLGTIAKGNKAVITFDARVTVPLGNKQTLLRLKNLAKVTYTSAAAPSTTGCVGNQATTASPCNLDTGYVVFYNGLRAPTIKEINP